MVIINDYRVFDGEGQTQQYDPRRFTKLVLLISRILIIIKLPIFYKYKYLLL